MGPAGARVPQGAAGRHGGCRTRAGGVGCARRAAACPSSSSCGIRRSRQP